MKTTEYNDIGRKNARLLKLFNKFVSFRDNGHQATVKAMQYPGFETGRKANEMANKWFEKASEIQDQISKILSE